MKKFFKVIKEIKQDINTIRENMEKVFEELKQIITVKSDRLLVCQAGRYSLPRRVMVSRSGREIIGDNETSRGFFNYGINNELSKMYQEAIPPRKFQNAEPVTKIVIPYELYLENCELIDYYDYMPIHDYFTDSNNRLYYIVDNKLDNSYYYTRTKKRTYFINKYTKKCSCEAFKYSSSINYNCKHAKVATAVLFKEQKQREYILFVLVMKQYIGFNFALDICSTIKY